MQVPNSCARPDAVLPDGERFSTPKTRVRILLAVSEPAFAYVFSPIVRALTAAVVQVGDSSALEQTLRKCGPFDLVLSDARLPGVTSISILAGLRREGFVPPYVIVQSLHQQLVRVVFGGGRSPVLSSRVVNDLALVELVEGLLGFGEPAPSSRRMALE